MSTNPKDTKSAPNRPPNTEEGPLDMGELDGEEVPQFGPKQQGETILPPSQPEIVKVKTASGQKTGNPFLKHFVDDPHQPDPAVRPRGPLAPDTGDVPDEHAASLPDTLDDLDDQILQDALEQDLEPANVEVTQEPAPAAQNEQVSEKAKLETQPVPDVTQQEFDPPDHAKFDQTKEPDVEHLETESFDGNPQDAARVEEPEAQTLAPQIVPEINSERLPAAPFVGFRGVQKTFDGKNLVVKDLNLNVARGEFLTLLGPSGSGKTTTLMMLAGFEDPTAGHIELDGQPISHLPPHKRNIGMVFQNYALFPHMTVWENLAFPLRVRNLGRGEIKEKIAGALKMVSLEGFEKRRPFQLSGGQQQRVAVARALVFNPALVLMDEPLGALDRHLREQMQFEIKKLHRDLGLTVVYVTHDQSEALTLSDRIAVFSDGQIQQADTPEALYERPANAFVASFVGENNKLSGTVEAADAEYAVVRLDGGQVIRAARRDCGGTGSRAVVTVRPEHLALTISQDAGGDRSVLAAHVEDTVFHGDHMRLKLTVPGSGDVIVKTQNRAQSLRGDTVHVAFRVADAPAFRPME